MSFKYFINLFFSLMILVILVGVAYVVITRVLEISRDTKIKSNVRQLGRLLKIYFDEKAIYLDGNCYPTSDPNTSCTTSAAGTIFNLQGNKSSIQIQDNIKDIIKSQHLQTDKTYFVSGPSGWTFSTPAIIPNRSLSDNGPSYCISDLGRLRYCTSNPNTLENSKCPDNYTYNNKPQTCQTLE